MRKNIAFEIELYEHDKGVVFFAQLVLFPRLESLPRSNGGNEWKSHCNTRKKLPDCIRWMTYHNLVSEAIPREVGDTCDS